MTTHTARNGHHPRPALEHPAGDAPEVVVQGVFLSPRVIDRRAYAELAGEVRAMIERAAVERSALTAALDQAGRAAQDIRQRELSQQTNLELAARALKTLDERSARVEALVEKAGDAAGVIERIDAKTGAIVDARSRALEAKLEALCSAAAARSEALEERLKRASRELEQRIEAIRRDAQTITAPAADALTALIARAEALAARTPGSFGELVDRAGGLQSATTATLERLEAACHWADAGRQDMDRWADGAAARMAELDARRRELETGAMALTQQCERLARDIAESRARAERSLDEGVDRAVAGAKARVDEHLVAAEAQARASADRAQSVAASLDARANEARTQAERAAADAQEAIDALRPRADAAARELAATIARSQDAQNTTSLALRLLDKSQAQVNTLLDRLAPWQPLLEGRDGAALPDPIRRLLDGVRTELRTDLSTIAAALRDAATKAERAVQAVDAPAVDATTPTIVVTTAATTRPSGTATGAD